ncbi:luciferin 4-monooxygenase-like [Diprion similis]|uniref:luciferin 4-monooxygenase-like n=1 Tax=Diprion similis TaxID=362088 RepID=UPI001EF7BFAB|nr:luciferin 4-monooxygenase-like [Diprion similis]
MPSCFSCLVPNPVRKTVANGDAKSIDVESKILRTPAPNFLVPPPRTSVGEFILRKFKATPDFVAQVDAVTGVEDTYGQMWDRSVRTALWLRKKGIKAGEVVAICTHNHCDTVIPMYATLYCGGAVAPWDPIMNCKDLKYMNGMSQPKIVFCDEESACTVLVALRESNNDAEVVVFGEHSKCTSFRSVLDHHTVEDMENFKCSELEDDSQIALIVCSSGSSGLPKGVEHTHRTVMLQFGAVKLLQLEGKTCTVFSSLYWISGLIGMFLCVAGNMKRVITPAFEEDFCSQLIEKYKINWVLMGSSILIRLIYSGCLEKYDMSSLEKISGGGGVVTAEAFGKLKATLPKTVVILGYGMTELGGAATIQDPNSKPGSCGRPVYGIACKVIERSTGKILGPGETGEICWQSPCIMKGYRNDPEATAEAIDKDMWLHSGDIGYYDEDGLIYVLDKLKEMIKYRGNQIAPAELESIIITHPGVKECAVVGKPDKIDVERPVAFVVKNPGAEVTEKDIVDLVASEVIERKQLKGGVRFIDKMPLTPSEKPKRTVLKEMLKNEA